MEEEEAARGMQATDSRGQGQRDRRVGARRNAHTRKIFFLPSYAGGR